MHNGSSFLFSKPLYDDAYFLNNNDSKFQICIKKGDSIKTPYNSLHAYKL